MVGDLGQIAIHYAEVEQMEITEPRAKKQKFRPTPASLPSNGRATDVARKMNTSLSAGAGKSIRTVPEEKEREAVLAEKTIHVEVIRFVDFFDALSLSNGQIFHELEAFNAIPLSVFAEVLDARVHCITRLLQELQARRHGMDMTGPGEVSSQNNSVAVSDLVKLIDTFVSPAAAFIICTARLAPPGRYTETEVQSAPARKHDPQLDGREKQQALATFMKGHVATFQVTWLKYEKGALQAKEIRDSHKCSITNEIMMDPVMISDATATDGVSYERSAITNSVVGDSGKLVLTENFKLRNEIEEVGYTRDYRVKRTVLSLGAAVSGDSTASGGTTAALSSALKTCNFRFQNGSAQTLQMAPAQLFGEAFAAVAAKMNYSVSVLKFIWDSNRLQVAQSYEDATKNDPLDDDEELTIDVSYEQTGGH